MRCNRESIAAQIQEDDYSSDNQSTHLLKMLPNCLHNISTKEPLTVAHLLAADRKMNDYSIKHILRDIKNESNFF